MTGDILLILFSAGILVGIISGLLGIGGGVLIVPFLYFFYEHPGWSGVEISASLIVPVAHATSLFIILPTAFRGVLRYHQIGVVVWRAVIPIAGASIIAAIAGARLALVVPGRWLEIALALILVISAVQMVRGDDGSADSGRKPGEHNVTLPRTLFTGAMVGLLSAMLGVGGGVIALPLLAYLIGLMVAELAGTSLAIVMFSSLSGSITYMLSGTGTKELPYGSVGYVHLLAAFPILAGSLLSVTWGARLNERLPTRVLRWVFAALFVLIAVQVVLSSLGLI